jgi:hypothetical protein
LLLPDRSRGRLLLTGLKARKPENRQENGGY